jgi:excisionase family DNA binding protein
MSQELSEKISMRPEEVAAATGLSLSTIRKMIRAGTLEGRHVGRCVIVPIAAVHALIDSAPPYID